MTTKSGRLPAFVLLAMAVFAVTTEAAPGAEADQPVTVTVGSGSAAPGDAAMLPLNLSAPESLAIGSVTVRIALPKALLSFVKIEPSGLALGTDAEVQAEVQPGPNDATSMLQANVSTLGKSGSRLAIPFGVIAYLSLKVDNSAQGGSITLTPEATAMTTGDRQVPQLGVVAPKAEVYVSPPPVSGCFLYMH